MDYQILYKSGNNYIETTPYPQKGNFYLQHISGLGYQNMLNTYKAVACDGEKFVSSQLDKRNINLEILVTADHSGTEDCDFYKNKLLNVFHPKIPGEIYIKKGNVVRKTKAYVESFDTKDNKNSSYAVISLLCPDPAFYDIQETVVSLPSWEGGFWFDAVYDDKIYEQRAYTGYKTFDNNGTLDTPFKIILTNLGDIPVVNPSIIKMDTGEFCKINCTLGRSDTLEIDTKNKKVFYNDQNYYPQRVLGSKFFYLNSGENVIKFDADSGKDYMNAVIYYENMYLGI